MSRRPYLLAALAVLVLDQASKALAHALLRGREPLEIIPHLFNLTYSRNAGGLFGYFSGLPDLWRILLLTLLPVGAIALIGLYLFRSEEIDRPTRWGLGLILGGAVGNLIDRVVRGEVIDFFDVFAGSPGLARWLNTHFGTAHWPTFNVADSAIVAGAALLMLSLVRPGGAKAAASGAG